MQAMPCSVHICHTEQPCSCRLWRESLLLTGVFAGATTSIRLIMTVSFSILCQAKHAQHAAD